jgi:hypothetical protein
MKIVPTIALLIISLVVIRAQTSKDRYPFVRGGKVGFIDYQGREVVPPRFSNAGDTAHFDGGLAPVFEAGRGSGYIDASGEFVIGPTNIWGWGRPFHEGIACVLIWNQSRNRAGWIDRTGKILFSGLGVEGTYFSEGLMSMPGPNGKWGFVDKYFQFVIAPRFDYASEFSDGRAEVTINRKSGFIDKSGEVVIPLKYDMAWPFSDGLARVRRDIQVGTWMTEEGEQPKYRYQYGFVDRDGNERIALQFEAATYFSNGYALAVPSNFKLFGIIDKQGRFVYEPEFEEAEEFHEGIAAVRLKDKWGYVDTNGAWVIMPSFIHARDFWHGLALVAWSDHERGYVDRSGKIIWKDASG